MKSNKREFQTEGALTVKDIIIPVSRSQPHNFFHHGTTAEIPKYTETKKNNDKKQRSVPPSQFCVRSSICALQA